MIAKTASDRKAKILNELRDRLTQALATVYQLDKPTPLQPWASTSVTSPVFLKREDQSKVHSYKWRGAFNKMSRLVEAGQRGPFVATSAGNHAQGVAISARQLQVSATIFMPLSTPQLKLDAVRRHGGQQVEIVLAGDSFDESHDAAMEFQRQHQAIPLPPFDDLDVIAGQATVGFEIQKTLNTQSRKLGRVFVPIGGGGLASGVSLALAIHAPDAQVIGVEVAGQDSMNQSIRRGQRSSLEDVDRFCDGTAVALPGEETFRLCRDLLHSTITVTNEQVCAAIGRLWETQRTITEPSGAVAMAGFLASNPGKTDHADVIVLSGSNMDFLKLASVVEMSRQARPRRSYFQFEIPEQPGALIGLLDQMDPSLNIVDFQYGFVNPQCARPIIGVEQISDREIPPPKTKFETTEVKPTLAGYRFIPFRTDLVHDAEFMRVVFPDRAGSLKEMMRESSRLINICYFDFKDSGETEGNALIGIQYQHGTAKETFLQVIHQLGIRQESVIENLGTVLR